MDPKYLANATPEQMRTLKDNLIEGRLEDAQKTGGVLMIVEAQNSSSEGRSN